MRQRHLFASALAIVVAGSAGYLLAGPLDPPPGPVQPSFRTVQEVYDRIEMLTPGPFCDNGPWDFLATPSISTNPTEVIAGDGLLHAIVMRTGGTMEILTDGGTTLIGKFDAGSDGRAITLNIRYTNGIWLWNSSSSEQTLLYRADPPPATE